LVFRPGLCQHSRQNHIGGVLHELAKKVRRQIDPQTKFLRKSAWRDNVFVERLWRSVKYEEVYLRVYDTVSEARASIGRYLGFYNGRRPHSSLDGITPDQAYFTPLPFRLPA
jgi:transposase InsO family protein